MALVVYGINSNPSKKITGKKMQNLCLKHRGLKFKALTLKLNGSIV
jgi:hypothetical protein